MFFEYVEADTSLGVDVGVIDSRLEHDFRRLEGVVRRESDAHEEHTSGIRAVSWTHDGSLTHGIWRQGRGRKEAETRTCQLNKSSPTGPALHEVGGSRWRSYEKYS